MTITAVTPLPSISRTDPDFKAKVNAFFLSQLPAWTAAYNAQVLEVQGQGALAEAYKNAAAACAAAAAAQVDAAAAQVPLAAAQVVAAAAQVTAANAAAALAAQYAGASKWVPGTYAVNDVRWSPVNMLLYRCFSAVNSAADPSADQSHWASPERSTVVAMAASNMDLAAGDYFTKTISGNTTLTISNVPAAPVRTELIARFIVTGGVITLPAGFVPVGGVVSGFPVGKTHLLFAITEGDGVWRYSTLLNFGS